MAAGELRRRDHRLVVDFAEPGDILGDSAAKQFHVLWQVSEMTAQFTGVPVLQIGAVEADRAGCYAPHADQNAGQARLAGGARPNYAEQLARADRE